MKRHTRENYFVIGEGILTYDEKNQPVAQYPSDVAALRKFRFSRLGPKGQAPDGETRKSLALAMTATGAQPDSADPTVPAGFTYLAQFIDHDLTMDNTDKSLGENVTLDELLQGRSPALDLDSLYGRGPGNEEDAKFYADGIRLRMGLTAATSFPDGGTNRDIDGFDLPRVGFGSTKRERRLALIPDLRNDENLAVAQVHLAFIRFHNRVVDHMSRAGAPSADLFTRARETVVKHYQWMIRTDFLPRVVDQSIVDDVFTNGRKFFEVAPPPGDFPTMPLEFSVAAYRLGHSMIRSRYQWNRVFSTGGATAAATLVQLFTFSGTSGILSPDGDLNDPESGSFERLPTNWIADFRRLFDLSEFNFPAPNGQLNITKKVDTFLVDPLSALPLGSFGGQGTTPPPEELNLAFRNLTRALMVELASGQQMAKFLSIAPLSGEQILNGAGGVTLDSLSDAQKEQIARNTPLWFYILREAELNGGRLTGVGGRIVAEVFHRAIEGSETSIVRDPSWRPTLRLSDTVPPDNNTFRMVDLVMFAFEGKLELLNPLGD